MIFLLTASPNPVPSGFVVKNGSKSRSMMCGGMPLPESEICSVTSSPSGIQVQISAPQDIWSHLRAGNFLASIDLSGASPGTSERDVQVETSEPQIRVVEVLPARVQIRLEALGRKSVAVRPLLEGAPPFGFNYQPARITPGAVSVRLKSR